MSQPHRISTFPTRLDAEWERLRTSRTALDTARPWGLVEDLTDLAQIVAATQPATSTRGDHEQMLLRLVELAADHELAGRIVIQRILGGLVSRATRYRDWSDGSDPIELIVSCAWVVIRTYDAERRRRHVASSLISDAVFQAFRAPLRRRSASEVVSPPDTFATMSPTVVMTTAVEELAAVLRDARHAGVPDTDLDLLRRLARDESPAAIAGERNVTDRTIRNHRDVATRRVRAAVAVAA